MPALDGHLLCVTAGCQIAAHALRRAFRGSQSEAVVVMGLLLEELARREAVARRRFEQIRQQMAS